MDTAEAHSVAAACVAEFPPTNPRVLAAAIAALVSTGEQASAHVVIEWARVVGHGPSCAGSPDATPIG
jgi:hypothetical protein